MRSVRFVLSSIALVAASAVGTLDPVTVRAEDSSPWPQWRGADQNGVAGGSSYPTVWSEGTGIKWKSALAGMGGSTPVIADSKIFVTAGMDGQNHLIALDVNSGEPVWNLALGTDRGNKHRKGGGSNPSAVTDGQAVYAYFRSGDLACVNLQGEKQWAVNLQEEFGEDTLWWDLGSSPTLIDDLVVVAVMQTGPSYLVAFDRKTGKQAWKVDRKLGAPEEAAQSYATPIALPELSLIAVMGADHLTIHSASDGREMGRVGGFNPEQEKYFRSISSPVAQGDLIVCPYSRGASVTTVRISDVIAGKGRDSIVWHRDDLGSDVPTPAMRDSVVYFAGDTKNDKGIVSAVDLETGTTLWTLPLPKSRIGFSSSPLVAANHLYVTSEDATCYVIGPLDTNQPDVVSINRVADSEEYTVASPVPVDGGLLMRTRHTLYRIGN